MQTVDVRIEERGLWWAFHKHLMIEMFEWLRERLEESYPVDLESQVLLVPYGSDLSRGVRRSASPDAEIAALEPTPALVEVDEALDEVEQYRIEIRRRDQPDALDPFGSQVIAVMVWASQVQPQARHHWGWGWNSDQPMPAVTIPLDYPHVYTLDLALCYQQAYESNRWTVRIGDES